MQWGNLQALLCFNQPPRELFLVFEHLDWLKYYYNYSTVFSSNAHLACILDDTEIPISPLKCSRAMPLINRDCKATIEKSANIPDNCSHFLVYSESKYTTSK